MGMKLYHVEIHCVVDVEAESEEEAIDEALGLDVLDLVWDADVIGVDEEETD